MFTGVEAACTEQGEVVATLESLAATFEISGQEVTGGLTLDFGFGASSLSFDAELAEM